MRENLILIKKYNQNNQSNQKAKSKILKNKQMMINKINKMKIIYPHNHSSLSKSMQIIMINLIHNAKSIFDIHFKKLKRQDRDSI